MKIFDSHQIKYYNGFGDMMEFEILKSPSYPYEGAVLISRYLYNLPGSIRMIKYLGKFSVEKERITNLYEQLEELVDKVFSELDKANFRKSISEDLASFFKPTYFNESFAKYLLRFITYNYDDFTLSLDRLNDFFEDFFISINGESRRDNLKISSISDVIKACEKYALSPEQKIQFISFYSNYEGFTKEIVELSNRVGEIIKENISLVKDNLKESFSFISSNNSIEQLMERYVHKKIEIKKIKIIVFLFENADKYLHYNKNNQNAGLFISFLYPKIAKINEGKKQIEALTIDIFKALSDVSRYKIVKILSNRRSYVQELAKMLDISPATVIHHLDVLKNAQIVEAIASSCDNKKIFYEINKMTISHVSETLLDLIG